LVFESQSDVGSPDANQARATGADHFDDGTANKTHVGKAFGRRLGGLHPGNPSDIA